MMNQDIFDNAPDWVEWAAMDADERWHFYQHSPKLGFERWLIHKHIGSMKREVSFTQCGIFWESSLIKRERKPKPTRQEILDHIEMLQEKANEEFLGSNEAELTARENIADYIIKLIER